MKKTITLTLNIPDSLAPVIVHNLDVLKNNERLTEFLSDAIFEKLQDANAIAALNNKVKLNGHGLMQSTDIFYTTILEKLKQLENEIDQLRFDMHTAAVLADKQLYNELTSDIMSTIDTLFQNISLTVKLNASDYLEQKKWLDKEQALQSKFKDHFNNFKMIKSAFDNDDIFSVSETEEKQETTSVEAELSVDNEAIQTILKEIEDLKYVLRTSTVLDVNTGRRNMEFVSPEPTSEKQVEQPQAEATNTTSEAGVVKETQAIPDVNNIDFSALSDFFG